MGSFAPDRQGDGAGGPLVAFDFDGTLTCRDSFRAFLAWRAGPLGYALRMASLAPAFRAFLFHRDRGRLKAAMVRRFLRGEGREGLQAQAERFHAHRADRLLRPDALACWRLWKEGGARLAIVTASPEILVAPFARALGAEALIGTRLAVDGAGAIAGALDGPNCRGAEKVVRLEERFGAGVDLLAAYGDSGGDAEMLAWATSAGLRVFKGRP